MNKWKSIEKAPRDGSFMLLSGGKVCESHYGSKDKPPMVIGRWIESKYREGWFYANWDGDWRSEYKSPTHWMPLPEEPND